MSERDPRLVIPLADWRPLPACLVYPPGKLLPAHSARLVPDALAAILPLADRLVLTTGYRSPQASATGWREDQARPRGKRKGVARPGFSPHGFGLAVDLDVERTLKIGAWPNKACLDGALEDANWCGYRADSRMPPAREAHHYLYLAELLRDDLCDLGRRGAKAGEAALSDRWPELATPDARRAQELLALEKCGDEPLYYAGRIDGDWGPKSRSAMARWHKKILGLDVDGRLDRFSWRALLVSTANPR